MGGPGIGYFQDYAAVSRVKDTPSYPRLRELLETVREKPTAIDYYLRDDKGITSVPAKKWLLAVHRLVPADRRPRRHARVVALLGDPGADNGMGKKLDTDIENYTDKGGKLEDNPPLYNLEEWWKKQGKPNSKEDFPVIEQARLYGGKQALTWTAYVPACSDGRVLPVPGLLLPHRPRRL